MVDPHEQLRRLINLFLQYSLTSLMRTFGVKIAWLFATYCVHDNDIKSVHIIYKLVYNDCKTCVYCRLNVYQLVT